MLVSLFISDLKLKFDCSKRFDSLHENFDRKLHSINGGFDWKVTSSDICIKIEIFLKTQTFGENEFPLKSEHTSLQLPVWHFPWSSQSDNSQFWREVWLMNIQFDQCFKNSVDQWMLYFFSFQFNSFWKLKYHRYYKFGCVYGDLNERQWIVGGDFDS